MAYNLWADKHLKLNLFSSTIYSEQTAWYPTVERACTRLPVRMISAHLYIHRGLRSPARHPPFDDVDQV
jgi:hypothetical protein